jgi:hypothetical protein
MFKKDALLALLKKAVGTVCFEDLSRYLPFQTRIVSGSTFNHIQSLTVYDIKTYGRPLTGRYEYLSTEYTVSEGDTLCRKIGRIMFERGGVHDENCPGCLAIAQGIIRRDIENAQR